MMKGDVTAQSNQVATRNVVEGEVLTERRKGFCDVCGLAFQTGDPLGLSPNRKLAHRSCAPVNDLVPPDESANTNLSEESETPKENT